MKNLLALLWKHLYCRFFHSQHRCYPTVWGPEQAKEWGIPYRPNFWHCMECHPCNEGFEELFGPEPTMEELLSQSKPMTEDLYDRIQDLVKDVDLSDDPE